MEPWARLELETPIAVPNFREQRVAGVWLAHELSPVYEELRKAEFVAEM